MKNTIGIFGSKGLVFLCAIALAAAGAAFVGCDNGSTGGGGEPGSVPENPITKIIAAQNISETWEAINSDVWAEGKYVILDLSACSAASNSIGSGQYDLVYTPNIIKDNPYIKGIIFPSSLETISYYAFIDCRYLTSVSVPANDQFRGIGPYAFKDCTSLTSVSFPANTAFIVFEEYAFSGCRSLTSVTIPSSVTYIGPSAFKGCTSLTGVTIPASVTTISPGTFKDCTSLTGVTIPQGVTTIGQYAFQGCASLTGVTIPQGVTMINPYVFEGCASLTGVTIPSSVTYIGLSAFEGCTSLTSVTFAGTIAGDSFSAIAFPGDLRNKYVAAGGGAGTYTRQAGGSTWTKRT